jgi:SAM-dependent methyltransferase
VAELYDARRPGYPEDLVDDILRISGIPPQGRILEIGSGTGKATLPFAQRGYSILSLEPGRNLLDVARRNLVAFPHVSFVSARFEEWDYEQESFDLVISAQAFHWVPQEVRYEKTARLLKSHGHLAIFWNRDPAADMQLRRELDQAYRQQAPELVSPGIPFEQVVESEASSLRESPYFDNVTIRQYPWSARYKTDAYLGLLNTYSDHLRLAPPRREALFQAVAGVIERNGGFIEKEYVAVAYVAERSSKT